MKKAQIHLERAQAKLHQVWDQEDFTWSLSQANPTS